MDHVPKNSGASQSSAGILNACGINTSNAAQLMIEAGCRMTTEAASADDQAAAALYLHAEEAFEAASILQPERPDALLGLLGIKYERRAHREVESLARRIVQMQNLSRKALLFVLIRKAQSFVLTQRLADAMECYEKCLRLDREACNELRVDEMIECIQRCLRRA